MMNEGRPIQHVKLVLADISPQNKQTHAVAIMVYTKAIKFFFFNIRLDPTLLVRVWPDKMNGKPIYLKP